RFGHGQTQRSRPRSISTRRADSHRRSSHQPHRRAPPLEHPLTVARRRTRSLAERQQAPTPFSTCQHGANRTVTEQLISTTLQKQVIEQQSFKAPLTEIYNRRSLDEIAGRFISHARRRKSHLTFLMIDVDKFKEVNSRFGHLRVILY